ncbi:MAG: acetate--CoA ligase family protein [Gammaproteobacteria bacterium]|nr:acetate--CoA ligase family protein [Gammaproteobacteria bacterium]
MSPEPGAGSMIRRLRRCLSPDSIAVVGGREVERVVFQCRKMGFGGDIQVVNPRRAELGGLPCVPDIDALREVPDAAFVAIPAEPSIEAMERLSRMGVGGAVCYASGFREVGAADRHQRLLAAAGDMPVIGPNCYGFINAVNGAVLWPDQHGMGRCDSGVAIFSASGNVSINMTMQQRGLPLALMVSIGNQANVGAEELLQAVLEDDRITAVGLLIEGLRDLPKFVEVAGQAAEADKPVVALKLGRSAAGAHIAMSHTATLAGESGLYDALFRRLGVAQVPDLEAFLESLKLLSVCGTLRGNRIASMSCSGGEASMVADLSESLDISFPPLDAQHRAAVAATLNEYVNVDNPLDYHTFIWGDSAAMEATFLAMMRGGYDLTLLVLDFPATNRCDATEWEEAARAFARAVGNSGYPGAVVVSMGENVTGEIIRELAGHGIPVLMGIPQALGAVEAASRAGRIRFPLPRLPSVVHGGGVAVEAMNPETCSEAHAKGLLAESGFRVPRGSLAGSVDDAVALAGEIGFPVVMKIAGDGVAHKSEHGGVRTGIGDPAAAREAAEALLAVSERILVEEMVQGSVAELILGVARDPQFGGYFMIGIGGTLVELLADSAILLPPLSDPDVREALSSLKFAPLLEGYRGGRPADTDAVIDSVMALEGFVNAHCGHLLEVDINPLIVHPRGGGTTVADALIIFGQPVNQ